MDHSTVVFILFSFPLFFFARQSLSVEVCKTSSCSNNGVPVRFPFRLKDRQASRCGYPGFDLSCNDQSQTVLTLPFSGDFIVDHIDYNVQAIFISDPEFCLPRRILNFSVSGSPFKGAYPANYTFYNCSSSSNWTSEYYYRAVPLYCLSSSNYTTFAMSSHSSAEDLPTSCRGIGNVSVPLQWFGPQFWSATNPQDDLQLIWDEPMCRDCEARGGRCGFKSDTGLQIGCSNSPSRGLPRSAKYGIIIGVGIPALVCLIGLVCYTFGRIRAYGLRRRLNTELSTATATPQLAIIVTGGLDKPTIESYPKTVLGESKRLPKPSDSTCPICLSEYQPKETLRTIPECNHYFHAKCVDEWLMLNATCPLCRNSPESSVVTPSSSISSSASSTSL